MLKEFMICKPNQKTKTQNCIREIPPSFSLEKSQMVLPASYSSRGKKTVLKSKRQSQKKKKKNAKRKSQELTSHSGRISAFLQLLRTPHRNNLEKPLKTIALTPKPLVGLWRLVKLLRRIWLTQPSMRGSLIHHQLLESTQTLWHWRTTLKYYIEALTKSAESLLFRTSNGNKTTQTAFSPSHPPKKEGRTIINDPGEPHKQHQGPTSRSGENAASLPRGFGCSTRSEKLL